MGDDPANPLFFRKSHYTEKVGRHCARFQDHCILANHSGETDAVSAIKSTAQK